jgi:hypothetical protein
MTKDERDLLIKTTAQLLVLAKFGSITQQNWNELNDLLMKVGLAAAKEELIPEDK